MSIYNFSHLNFTLSTNIYRIPILVQKQNLQHKILKALSQSKGVWAMRIKLILFILLITLTIPLPLLSHLDNKYLQMFATSLKLNELTVTEPSKAVVPGSTDEVRPSPENNTDDEDSNLLDSTVLKQGDKGSKVTKLQKKLNEFGYNIETDGNFGVTTLDAVLNLQYRLGLDPDGIVGNDTIKQLNLPPTDKTKKEEIAIAVDNFQSSNAQEEYVNNKGYSSKTDYLIWLDLESQHVNIFTGASKHWKLDKRFVCASGTGNTPTVRGTFQVESKGVAFRAGSNCICKFYTGFYGNYLFHSVLLDNNGNVTDGTLGTPASHGCVRLAIDDAKYIYGTVPHYTTVISN